MKRLLPFILALLLAACNLGTPQEARELQLIASQTAVFAPDDSAAPDSAADQPTADVSPTPIALIPVGSPRATIISSSGGACDQLRVDVGSDPGNTLRLRQQPTNNAEIILLIPNSSTVTRVSGTGEVAADGYTWLNIQYTDPNGVIATGWAAKNAMRDRATLAPAC